MPDDSIQESPKGSRRDCCEICAEADRIGGCQYAHPNGSKGMVARCCPPGTDAKKGCEGCWPCGGFHLKGSAYFATGTDKLFRERGRFQPVRHQRPYDQKRRARNQLLVNKADRAVNDWRERS